MRPYRGKRKDNGEWVYGWYVQRSHKDCCVYHYIYTGAYFEDDDREGTELEVYEVDPTTVGQQVGLKDKNGKESYAGDRVSIPRFDSSFIIKWDNFNAKYYMQSEQNNHIIDIRFLPEEGEIIGNEHTEQSK